MDDDSIAIRRLKNGDIGGLESLVCRYQVKAVRAAFFILRDEQAAEDVAQETFLRIFRHINRFDESRPFGPYLFKSVVNAALDAARNESRREIGIDDLNPVDGLLQQAIKVETQAEFNVLKHDIFQALERLSPRQRAAVVMRYYFEMSEKEMADILQARPGTIKWLLNAARQRLRMLLGAERSAQ